MKATDEQIAEWQSKYGVGNICELTCDDKVCYVVDPATDLIKMKAMIAARKKSVFDMVDCLMNNCFLGGDEDFKTDAKLKMGIGEQVDDIMDIPDSVCEDLEGGNVRIVIGEDSVEVRLATRMDLEYAEHRDRDNKPLAWQGFLLDRIAVNSTEVDDLRKKPKQYLSALLAVGALKDKKYVSLKKF